MRILNGDPSGDGEWEVETDWSPTVSGYRAVVVVRDGEVVDSRYVAEYPTNPHNYTTYLHAAEEAVADAIAFHRATKGFGWHPDVVM